MTTPHEESSAEARQQLAVLKEKYQLKCERHNWFHDLYLDSQKELADEKLVSEGLRENLNNALARVTRVEMERNEAQQKLADLQEKYRLTCENSSWFRDRYIEGEKQFKQLQSQVDQMTRDMRYKEDAYNDLMVKWRKTYDDCRLLTRDIQRKDEALEQCKKYLWTNGVHRPFESIVKLIQSALTSEDEHDNKEDVKDPL